MRNFTYNGKTVQVSRRGIISYQGKPLSTCDNGRGYINTTIQYRKFYVHRVVLEAYKGPPPEGKTDCNHKNGIKSDNRPSNLEWCSRSYNVKHAYDKLGRKPSCNQLGKCGFDHHKTRPVARFKNDNFDIFGSLTQASINSKISRGRIIKCIEKMQEFKGFNFIFL